MIVSPKGAWWVAAWWVAPLARLVALVAGGGEALRQGGHRLRDASARQILPPPTARQGTSSGSAKGG
eukprot:COSAG04_NODE_28908_length_272_cov_0.895954_1_plen_66_part_01